MHNGISEGQINIPVALPAANNGHENLQIVVNLQLGTSTHNSVLSTTAERSDARDLHTYANNIGVDGDPTNNVGTRTPSTKFPCDQSEKTSSEKKMLTQVINHTYTQTDNDRVLKINGADTVDNAAEIDGISLYDNDELMEANVKCRAADATASPEQLYHNHPCAFGGSFRKSHSISCVAECPIPGHMYSDPRCRSLDNQHRYISKTDKGAFWKPFREIAKFFWPSKRKYKHPAPHYEGCDRTTNGESFMNRRTYSLSHVDQYYSKHEEDEGMLAFLRKRITASLRTKERPNDSKFLKRYSSEPHIHYGKSTVHYSQNPPVVAKSVRIVNDEANKQRCYANEPLYTASMNSPDAWETVGTRHVRSYALPVVPPKASRQAFNLRDNPRPDSALDSIPESGGDGSITPVNEIDNQQRFSRLLDQTNAPISGLGEYKSPQPYEFRHVHQTCCDRDDDSVFHRYAGHRMSRDACLDWLRSDVRRSIYDLSDESEECFEMPRPRVSPKPHTELTDSDTLSRKSDATYCINKSYALLKSMSLNNGRAVDGGEHAACDIYTSDDEQCTSEHSIDIPSNITSLKSSPFTSVETLTMQKGDDTILDQGDRSAAHKTESNTITVQLGKHTNQHGLSKTSVPLAKFYKSKNNSSTEFDIVKGGDSSTDTESLISESNNSTHKTYTTEVKHSVQPQRVLDVCEIVVAPAAEEWCDPYGTIERANAKKSS